MVLYLSEDIVMCFITERVRVEILFLFKALTSAKWMPVISRSY